MGNIRERCRRCPYALKTYRIDAFGKHYIFHLPEDLLYEKLLAFEREHFGKVEFEIFGKIAEESIDNWIMIHTKEGDLMSDIYDECKYCHYLNAGYIDYTFGEYRQEFEAFEDNQLTIPLGALGAFDISNYIQLVKDNDGNEKAIL